MYQSLFFKEWIKTRRTILLISIVFAAFIAYTFIHVNQMFRVNGHMLTWFHVMMKDITLIPKIKWLPLLSGISLSLSQFIPEVVDKRLKLTLHLPLPESMIMLSMLAYGLGTLTVLFCLSYLCITAGLGLHYPSEIVIAAVWGSLPWFIAGMAGYFCVGWICIEPAWKQRMSNTLIAVWALSLFFIDSKSGAYAPFIPILAFFVPISFSLPLYASERFKNGVQ